MLQDAEADIGQPYPGDSDHLAALKGNFHQLALLKERHPHLKTMISMGGWTGSGRFSDAVATEEKRREFVASCIELFLTRWPGVFDGIDIDWEYPVCCGLPENSYRPEDRRNCTLLFEELRRQLDDAGCGHGPALPPDGGDSGRPRDPSHQLRAARGRTDPRLDQRHDLRHDRLAAKRRYELQRPVRRIERRPERSRWKRFSSVVGTIGSFLDEGVPRDKLVVGVPFYGRGFTGVPAGNDGLYQPFTGTISTDYHTITSDYLAGVPAIPPPGSRGALALRPRQRHDAQL